MAKNPEVPDEDLPRDIPRVTVRNKIDLTGEAPGLVQREPPVLAMSATTGARGKQRG